MDKQIVRCKDCLWWEGNKLMNNPVGECRRYPPRKTRAKGDWWDRRVKAREWPVTEANDWCGEGMERGKL